MSSGRRPTLLLLALAWVAVVVVVAGVTWQVIDSAGRQVLSGGPAPLSASGTTGGAEGASPRSPGPDSRRSPKKPSPSARPTPKVSSGPAATGATPAPSSAVPSQGGGQPSEQPTSRPGSRPSDEPSEEPSQPSSPPPSTTQVRSWHGSAGTVTAACQGARISLESVTPNDGWQVEIGGRGPEDIEVEFKSGGEDERETKVRAECGGGVPRYDVEADD